MSAAAQIGFEPRFPIDLAGAEFARDKYDWYPSLLEDAPVCPGRISLMKLTLVSRYEDCRFVLSDERFLRNRGHARGKRNTSPIPIPVPKSIAVIARSMILEDDPEHRRLRNLVNKAFTARAVGKLEHRVESMAESLLDGLEAEGGNEVDLLPRYARVIPTRVIAEMMGLTNEDVAELDRGLRVLTEGLSGLSILRTILWDLRGTGAFIRGLIARKRKAPGDDILTALISAEEDGDRLGEEELVAMVFLLIIAGFETTLHLIGNGVRTLLEHPDQLDRLKADPTLWATGVDEIVRYRSPVQGTKLQYPSEDLEIAGQVIRRGSPIMPLLGAANQDPRAFERPERFDVGRIPNHHLGFGFGAHFCLGKQLALMEARVALQRLFERFPDLRLAVEPEALEIVNAPGWHRHKRMPVRLSG